MYISYLSIYLSVCLPIIHLSICLFIYLPNYTNLSYMYIYFCLFVYTSTPQLLFKRSKDHLIETTRPFIKAHWGMCICIYDMHTYMSPLVKLGFWLLPPGSSRSLPRTRGPKRPLNRRISHSGSKGQHNVRANILHIYTYICHIYVCIHMYTNMCIFIIRYYMLPWGSK